MGGKSRGGRTYRYQTDTGLVAELVHLPLFLPVQQAVMVLHADELGPPSPLGGGLHRRELIGPHAARADIPHFPTLDQIVQGFHRLLHGHGFIVPVDLEEIDVGCVETAKGGFDGVEDSLTGEAALVDVVDRLINILEGERFRIVTLAGGATAFAQDDELVAGEVVFFDGLADNFFRDAVAVDVGCVPLFYAHVSEKY